MYQSLAFKVKVFIVSFLIILVQKTKASEEHENPKCIGKIHLLQVIECVLEHSPEYKHEKLELGVREGRKIVNSYLFPSNPFVSFSQSVRYGNQENFLGTNNRGYFLNGEILVSQEIFISNIRKTKLQGSEIQINSQYIKLEILRRETISEAIKASIRYENSKKFFSETQNLYNTAVLLHNVILEKVKAGVLAPIDSDLAYAEVLKVKKLYELAKRQHSKYKANLTVMMGISFHSPLEITFLPENIHIKEKNLEKLLQNGLKNRPEILLAEQNILFHKKNSEVLALERIPNLTITGFLQKDGFNENVVGIRVGLPLRVWKTQKGELLENNFKEKQAEELKEIQLHTIKQEIIEAIENFESLSSELKSYSKESLKHFETSLKNLQKAMQNGQIPIKDGLITQQYFISAKLSYLETFTEWLVSAIEVLRACGFPILEFEIE